MIETEHWLFSYLFADHRHILQPHLVNVLSKVSIGLNRIQFGLKLCVDIRVEVNFVAFCRLPFQKFIMNLSVLNLLLSCLDLLNNSVLFRQFISLFPKSLAVLLNLFNTLATNYFRNLSKVVSSKLFTTSNKVVKIIL